MTFTKHMVLLGGVLALVAFFVPFTTVRQGPAWVKVSGFEIVKGVDSVSEVSNVTATEEQDAQLRASDTNQTKGAALLIFGPPMLLLVIGGIAEKRRKFQRLGGVGALVLGASGTLFAAGLMAAIKDEATSNGADFGVGAGTYLLLVGSLLGLLAGLLALIKPDRG
jgi:hypothetical protein